MEEDLLVMQRQAVSDHICPPGSDDQKPTLLGGKAIVGQAMKADITGRAAQRSGSKERPRWAWPDWALRKSTPDIEVFVQDDQTGRNRWVDAVPHCRVVDRDGHDTFLHVRYEWDGEFYDEDFAPDQVRKRGSATTISELLCVSTADVVTVN